MKKHWLTWGFLSLTTTGICAQEYPYDKPNTPASTDTVSSLPKESPDDSGAEIFKNQRKPVRSLNRFSLRLGSNYALLQSSLNGITEITHGLGLEGIVGIGWDLRFFPAFVELETGYRQHFLGNDTPFHMIPLGFGYYLRTRLGARSNLKYGFKGGLDFRYSTLTDDQGTFSTGWAVVPHWGVALQFEASAFVIEPFFYLNRLQNSATFFSGGLRLGFRL